jgi:hypothetical protein
MQHAQKQRIAVKRPGGGVAYFKVLVLPFGATGRVAVFLRVSSAIAFIGLEADTTFHAEGLFKLRGINLEADGSKAPPFLACFRTLGLMIDAEGAMIRMVRVGHTPERAKELPQCIEDILDHKSVSIKALEQLHGRIGWFRTLFLENV